MLFVKSGILYSISIVFIASIFWFSRRTSVIIKTQLVKLSEAFNLFFFFLPIVLLNVRSTHFGKQIVTLRNKY